MQSSIWRVWARGRPPAPNTSQWPLATDTRRLQLEHVVDWRTRSLCLLARSMRFSSSHGDNSRPGRFRDFTPCTKGTYYSSSSPGNQKNDNPPYGVQLITSIFRFQLRALLTLILVTAGTVFYEMKMFKRHFQQIVPDSVAESGGAAPAKYIYSNGPLIYNSSWWMRYFPWISFCQAPVWHYIVQTKSHDPVLREEAIKKLLSLKHLSDREYMMIASAIDFKTAVVLAHSGANPSMVTRPGILHPDKKNMCLASKFREILSSLPPDSIHEAMLNACFAALKTYRPTEAEKLDNHVTASASGFLNELYSLRPLRTISEESFLKPCLQALLSHSRIKEQIPLMLKNGVMELILVIVQKYRTDEDLMGIVAKILSSFTCSPDCIPAFEESGILGLIAEFAASDDVRLSFPARKALHNLDRENSEYTLPPGIYQVHPDFRINENHIEIDIIFVHGLMGGAFRTWRSQDLNAVWRLRRKPDTATKEGGLCEIKPSLTQWQKYVEFLRQKIMNSSESDLENVSRPSFRNRLEAQLKSIPQKLLNPPEEELHPKNRELRGGKMYYYPRDEDIPLELAILSVPTSTKCWPRDWLPMDVKNIRVICADFETFITHWSPVMPVENLGRSIQERSHELIQKLSAAGVGDRPIIWVCHSAGGIIIKQVLDLAENNEQEALHRISQKTRAVVFCGTPHFGSRMTGLKSGKSILLPTVEIIELMRGSNVLHRLDESFQSLVNKYNYKVMSFGELCPTLGSVGISRKLVPVDSSDPGYGDAYYGLRIDHLNICKPKSRSSFVYVKIRDLIRLIKDQEVESGKEN